MNKEEQLRIYSAYLPYKLQVIRNGEENPETLRSVKCHWHKNTGSTEFNEYHLENIKPILYDLSYLTRDEFNFIWENEVDTDSLEQAISLDAESFLTCKFSYSFWTELFKNHFNVFNLPPDQFINKATLTTNK